MAEFSKLIITGKGQTLIAKMIAENAGMKFTKIATSGTMYKPEQLEGLEALTDIKQTSLIAKITRTNDVAVKIETSFNNLELTEGYYMRALGLYADDPDEGEILYAVTTEVSGNCYIPPYNGVTVSGAYVKLITTVGNAQHVSLEVDAAATATIGNIQDLRDNLDAVEISFSDEEVTERENIQPRDTLGTICRKIKKWLSDLKTGAFASVVDNCTTTEEGTVLDGRQGKALQDQITELREADGEINSNMGGVRFGVDANGNYGYKKVGADTVIPFKRGAILIGTYNGNATITYNNAPKGTTASNFLVDLSSIPTNGIGENSKSESAHAAFWGSTVSKSWNDSNKILKITGMSGYVRLSCNGTHDAPINYAYRVYYVG